MGPENALDFHLSSEPSEKEPRAALSPSLLKQATIERVAQGHSTPAVNDKLPLQGRWIAFQIHGASKYQK
jgi:hypothetical protein